MTPQEYAEAQAVISAAAAAYVLKFSQFVANAALTTAEWIGFLQLLFPTVERYRTDSADLARKFYDSERSIHNPTLPRHDVFLETYDFRTFVTNMEPTRKQLSAPQAPKQAVANAVMHVAREVEDAGRQQIIKSVQADYDLITQVQEVVPEQKVSVTFEDTPVTSSSIKEELDKHIASGVDQAAVEKMKRDIAESAGRVTGDKQLKIKPTGPVRGWARVATGKETCAFCLMLISRGPVYLSAKGAGLDLHDAGAAAAIGNGEDVSQWMNQWHIGCDCKVIPVYDKLNWPGMYAADRALELWGDADEEAVQILKDNPGKKYYSKKERRWLPTTRNREAINSLRRRLDSGEISTQEFAALAA